MIGKNRFWFSEPWKNFFQTLEKTPRRVYEHWKPAGWVFFCIQKNDRTAEHNERSEA